ncbi:threonine/serine exporter family protein [Bacillus sp. 03113]|uniref:threonine/serine exporter family protein n=1 Tax=Bacillus sp. 03113 TaxID=2578211 RepID=UPI00114192B2|nr:threonine/serine exporter family protein [Bacillus sp. 03113]
MENQSLKMYEIFEVCTLAGKIMLQNGAETYRVEDTMKRIAASYGILESNSFVTPTGLIFSLEKSGEVKTKMIRINDRTTNLEKVTKVNSISRDISNGEVSVQEAQRLLKEVNAAKATYPLSVQIGAAALSSGCFVIMFQGTWSDFLPALLAGGIGFLCLTYFHYLVPIKFFSECLASFIIGIVAYFFVKMGFGDEIDKIIIGSVMPLVPGVLITNAVRDLMAGDLVSGLSKGAEAFLTAFAIGTGVAIVFLLL